MNMRQWTSAVAALATAVVLLLPSRPAQAQLFFVDTIAPKCCITTLSTSPRTIIITIWDQESGILPTPPFFPSVPPGIQFVTLNANVLVFGYSPCTPVAPPVPPTV